MTTTKTTDSFHRRNRRLLVDLTSEDVVGETLAQVGRHHGWPADVRWRPEWGRIEDSSTARVRLLFEAENLENTLCTLEVGAEGEFVDPVFGPIRAMLFPSDGRLATLSTVLDRHVGARIIRYRPGKRCTLRTADTAPRYVKVFADGRAQQLYAEGVELWEASQRGAFGFRIARPLGFDPTERTYSQAEVAGRPITDELFELGGPALARSVGYACGSIPASGLHVSNVHRASTELDRTRRRADELLRYVPALTTRVRALVKALEDLHDDLVDAPLRPIHGSPHPNQWLVSDSGLGLVDFDRLSLSDPSWMSPRSSARSTSRPRTTAPTSTHTSRRAIRSATARWTASG